MTIKKYKEYKNLNDASTLHTAFYGLILEVKEGLRAAQETASSPVDNIEKALQLMDALEAGRFGFEAERWYALHGETGATPYPSELLLRARDLRGRAISPGDAIAPVNALGLHKSFDRALVMAALVWAIQDGIAPVSVNVSARNAGDAAFWRSIDELRTRHFADHFTPADLTLEITEDAIADDLAVETLLGLKAKGYRFAIDDASHQPHDEARQRNLALIADYIKIDGKTVRDGLAGKADLGSFVQQLRSMAPEAHIITEWVRNAGEARRLQHNFGIHAVQGERLRDGKRGGFVDGRLTPASSPRMA